MTPDEEIAANILSQFKEIKLLSDDAIKKLGDSLAKGQISAEEWRLVFETDQPMTGDGDGHKDN